jgi:hypothetical protein
VIGGDIRIYVVMQHHHGSSDANISHAHCAKFR